MDQSVLGDRYRVEAKIGAGGMAEVYRGFDQVLNRTVAIKVLNPQFARDDAFVERFRREAQAAARLNHPNIVGVYDHGTDNGTQYIVMEFIEGRTLADALSAGRRPTPVQSAEVTQHICAALAAAHAQGVIHRDIKPENVMVTRDGTVKVMDFGIARMLTGPETAPQTSAVLGTASYLSPEQAQGQPVDARSDIYSLGTVLYEMLTGRPPFTGDSPVAIAYKHVNETPVPPSHRDPDIPPQLDAVVMRALAKNPANRYQSADEFADDLERVRRGEDVQATPLLLLGSEATQVISRGHSTQVLPPQTEPPGSGRKVWLGVLIGFLIIAVLTGGGYLAVKGLTSSSSSPTPAAFVITDVLQKPYVTAKALLEAQGLTVTDPPLYQVDETVAPGTVLLQSPVVGASVKKGDTVTLTVARGSKKVQVPDLTDMTLSQAQNALSPLTLGIGTKQDAPSDTVAKGSIISQNPPAGAKVSPNSLVDVVVSTGPSQVTLPDVTCLTLGVARTQLLALGLNTLNGGTTGTTVNPLCPQPNRIAAMDPAANTKVNVGSTVTVYFNATPPPTSP
jgi:eukaryotic-like serine/threonine-protein kinase